MNRRYWKSTIILITFFFIIHRNMVFGDFFLECENVSNNYIESNKGCNYYIFCDGMNSFEDKCDDGFYFNKEFQTCDPKDTVDCRFDTIMTSTTIITTRITTTPRTTLVPTFNFSIITPAIPSQLSTTTTPPTVSTIITTAEASTMITNDPNMSSMMSPSSTLPSTTTTPTTPTTPTTTQQQIITTPSFAVYNECPIVDNPYQMVFVPHPKSCSDYYMCYHGKATPMHCSAMLHFNIRTGRCDYPENAQCRADYTIPKEQCQSHTIDIYPHTKNCNYYYYCKNGYLMLQQCPIFFGWDLDRRACVPIKQAKCYNDLSQ